MKMKLSPVLCKCFTSIIFYAYFAVDSVKNEQPEETDRLLELLQIAFIRGS